MTRVELTKAVAAESGLSAKRSRQGPSEMLFSTRSSSALRRPVSKWLDRWLRAVRGETRIPQRSVKARNPALRH